MSQCKSKVFGVRNQGGKNWHQNSRMINDFFASPSYENILFPKVEQEMFVVSTFCRVHGPPRKLADVNIYIVNWTPWTFEICKKVEKLASLTKLIAWNGFSANRNEFGSETNREYVTRIFATVTIFSCLLDIQTSYFQKFIEKCFASDQNIVGYPSSKLAVMSLIT